MSVTSRFIRDGKSLGRFADANDTEFTSITLKNKGDTVIFEAGADLTGYAVDDDLLLDPNANSYTLLWDGEDWVVIDQDSGAGGGAANLECVELTLINPPGEKIQLQDASYDESAQEWSGIQLGVGDVVIPKTNVSGFESCECVSAGNNVVSGVPAGIIEYFHGTLPPDGWLVRDGSSFDQNAYPQLAAAIGGNVLPDDRGRVIRALDPTGLIDPDGATRTPGSQQSDAIAEHNHLPPESQARAYVTFQNGPGSFNNGTFRFNFGTFTFPGLYSRTGGVGDSSSPVATETRMKNTSYLPIIKHD